MATTVNDKFIKTVRLWTGTVAAPGVSSPSSTTIPYTGTGLTEGEVYIVTANRVTATGTKNSSSVWETFVGKVQSGSFINCIRGVEGSADAWAVGTVLEILLTMTQWNRLIEGIEAEHNQDGTHKSATVTTLKATGTEINTGTEDAKIVTPKAIGDSNVVFTDKTQTLTNKTFQKTVQTWVTATDGTTVTFNLSQGNLQKVTLGGNRTLALSNVSTGQCFVIKLIQDATGSRTVTWFSTIRWAGGSAPTLTTTANKADVFGFICTGTNTYDGFVVGQNL